MCILVGSGRVGFSQKQRCYKGSGVNVLIVLWMIIKVVTWIWRSYHVSKSWTSTRLLSNVIDVYLKQRRQRVLNETNIEQQRKADENLLILLKEQQREKNESLKQVAELKRVSPLDEVTKKLSNLQEEYDGLDGLCQQLNSKERLSNDNFQEVQKALIEGLIDVPSSSRATIGVKRMGEIDVKAFKKACKKRFSPDEADLRAVEMCSTWQEKLKNPNWHPFRMVTDKGGNHRREIDEDDESLVGLCEEWGDGVYNSVTTALMELQDCNPSGCYPVPELWNFKADRKATVKEVIQHLFDKQKKPKRKTSVMNPVMNVPKLEAVSGGEATAVDGSGKLASKAWGGPKIR